MKRWKKTRIWKITYGNWTSGKVTARNVNEAIRKSIRYEDSRYCNMSDVTCVELIAETEELIEEKRRKKNVKKTI